MNEKIKWNMIVEQFKSSSNYSKDELNQLWLEIFTKLLNYRSFSKRYYSDSWNYEIYSSNKQSFFLIAKDISCNDSTFINLIAKSSQRKTTFFISDNLYIIKWKEDDSYTITPIPFETDSPIGTTLISSIDNGNYSEDSISNFLTAEKIKQEHILEIKNKLSDKMLVLKIIENYFSNSYQKDEIDKAFNESSLFFSNGTSYHNKKLPLDESILLKGGRKSAIYFKSILEAEKIMPEDSKFTMAKLNKDIKRDNKRFWANPLIDFIYQDWYLALNDISNRKIDIFFIPKNSIQTSQIKTRILNSKELIDLEIIKESGAYVDIGSKIDFSKWLIQSIEY